MIAAALGTTVLIETLDGPAQVQVKPGTQSGAPVVIKGKGMTRLRRGDRGDLVVHIEVQTPTKLSKEEESILRSFAQVRGEKASEAHVKGQDGSVLSKLKGVFNK
jgi:molecular chaperone DnaJ